MKIETKRGFTLIELLIVISIIGILSSVVLVSLNSARAKSRDARRFADVRQIQTALELFYNDNTNYPDDAGVGALMTDGVPPFNTYINFWPTAPGPADGACSTAQNDYTYQGRNVADTADDATNPASYQISFCLGASIGNYNAGVKVARPTGLGDN